MSGFFVLFLLSLFDLFTMEVAKRTQIFLSFVQVVSFSENPRSARRGIWRYCFSFGVWDFRTLNHVVQSQLFVSLWDMYHQWFSDIKLIQIGAFLVPYSRVHPCFPAVKRIGVCNKHTIHGRRKMTTFASMVYALTCIQHATSWAASFAFTANHKSIIHYGSQWRLAPRILSSIWYHLELWKQACLAFMRSESNAENSPLTFVNTWIYLPLCNITKQRRVGKRILPAEILEQKQESSLENKVSQWISRILDH